MLFGYNPSASHPIVARRIVKAKEKGAKIIVVDPRCSRTAAKADWWIPIRPGTDAALMLGMMKWIIDNDKIDKDYIRSTTNGAFLVDKSTKKLVMSNGKYLVWDEKANQGRRSPPRSTILSKPHLSLRSPFPATFPRNVKFPKPQQSTGHLYP